MTDALKTQLAGHIQTIIAGRDCQYWIDMLSLYLQGSGVEIEKVEITRQDYLNTQIKITTSTGEVRIFNNRISEMAGVS